ncbi:hypothetical protein D3C85_917080 [compost metagenome]
MQGPADERQPGQAADPRGGQDRAVAEPVPARAFFEGVFQAAEEQRQKHHAQVIRAFEQRQFGLVDLDQHWHGDRDENPRHQVDVEQPVPGRDVGDPATDHRPQCRCQGRHCAYGRGGDHPLLAGEEHEGRGEHQWNHRAAQKPLQGTEGNHALDVPGHAAQQAGQGETHRRCAEQPARREHPRQPARQGDHDDFGDQVAGLHPRGFVGASGEPAADVTQRRRDNLDIQQRNEHADAHAGKGEDLGRRRHVRGIERLRRGGEGTAHGALATAGASGSLRVSTSAVTDNPGRRWPSTLSAGSR